MKEQYLSDAKKAIRVADQDKVEEIAEKAIAEGIDPVELLEDGFVAGITEVGMLFEEEKIFLPELMLSAKAMKKVTEICNKAIPKERAKQKGKVVLGTVEGDIHDIGKSIVESFLSASGFEVYDLGRDVKTKN
jgi:trimethylamine corrinoid protein